VNNKALASNARLLMFKPGKGKDKDEDNDKGKGKDNGQESSERPTKKARK
jgi:hypothetical protein